jgi:hypothetical protein
MWNNFFKLKTTAYETLNSFIIKISLPGGISLSGELEKGIKTC